MPDNLHLKIITPAKIVFEEDVYSVTTPSANGVITILPHHQNLFTLLTEGIIKIKKGGEENYLAIGGGYLETDGEDLMILVSKAYKQNEIDEKATLAALEEAKKLVSRAKDKAERREASAVMRRSLINLKLLKRRNRQNL